MHIIYKFNGALSVPVSELKMMQLLYLVKILMKVIHLNCFSNMPL